ncbi:MAG TPA: hypothetical protein VMU39_10725 [Solirubrobacteraceae bacterium]|nr:hypothetical protein [Solirubrobacteraceae bacterium]
MIRTRTPSATLSRRRKSTAVAVAAGLSACALAIAGCGGSSGSVIDPVAQAATTSTGSPGYRMNITLQLSVPGSSTVITATGTGSVDTRDRAGAMAFDMNFGNSPQIVQALGGSTLHMEEILKGLVVYVKMPPAIASKLPGGKAWMKIDLSKASSAAGIPGLSSLANNPASSDPSQFLQYLRAVSGGVSKVGSDSVGGVQATHYRASIDLDRVPDVLPAASRAAGKQATAALEKATNLHQLPVDVWIDDQHLVRQLKMAFTSAATGGQSVRTAVALSIPQYGPQPVPQAPPAGQVTDLTSLLGASG